MNELILILLMICSGVFVLILVEYGIPIIEALIGSFFVFGFIGLMIGWIYG